MADIRSPQNNVRSVMKARLQERQTPVAGVRSREASETAKGSVWQSVVSGTRKATDWFYPARLWTGVAVSWVVARPTKTNKPVGPVRLEMVGDIRSPESSDQDPTEKQRDIRMSKRKGSSRFLTDTQSGFLQPLSRNGVNNEED